MTTGTPEERDPREIKLEQLVTMARTLVREFDEYSKNSGSQLVALARRARTNRFLILITLGSLVLDLMLTIVLTIVSTSMVHNTDRIDTLTQRLDLAQTVQRQKALCPLYQVFLDSKSPQGRKAAPDPKKYDHAFVVIKQGYDALECDHYITGTPAPVSPAPRS